MWLSYTHIYISMSLTGVWKESSEARPTLKTAESLITVMAL